jgi:O-methyltransferase domain/Dimerisation domain
MATQTSESTASIQVLRMTDGLIMHQCLYAAAKLGIADLLNEGERSMAELASELKVNERGLYRTLRFLSGQGVFEETGPSRFTNTALSDCLRTGVPGSVRSILIFRGGHYYFSPFADFLYSVETGKPARDKASGLEAFEYLRHHPEEARIFDDAMNCISAIWAPAIAAAYDFGSYGSLMDVGGGNGLLLATILRAHPGLCGVLADQEHVLKRAREHGFLSGELEDRVRLQPTDFFQSVPSGCRAYMMKNVIHDWDDDRAYRILLNCRRAVPDDGKLLLVEYCLGAENTPALGKTVDIVMLALTGGTERTIGEHRKLLAAAGFGMSRIISVCDEVLIVEAKPT